MSTPSPPPAAAGGRTTGETAAHSGGRRLLEAVGALVSLAVGIGLGLFGGFLLALNNANPFDAGIAPDPATNAVSSGLLTTTVVLLALAGVGVAHAALGRSPAGPAGRIRRPLTMALAVLVTVGLAVYVTS